MPLQKVAQAQTSKPGTDQAGSQCARGDQVRPVKQSYWRLSKTLATNSGLSKAFFVSTGLIFVREQLCKIHHPATARCTLDVEWFARRSISMNNGQASYTKAYVRCCGRGLLRAPYPDYAVRMNTIDSHVELWCD